MNTAETEEDPRDVLTEVMSLLYRGVKPTVIAVRLGVPKRRVTGLINAARRQWEEVADPAVARWIDDERIAAMVEALWPQVVRGEIAAVGIVARLLQRRARMLGYDKQPGAASDEATLEMADAANRLTQQLDRLAEEYTQREESSDAGDDR